MHGANVQPGQIVLVTRRARPGGARARDRRGGLRARRAVRRRLYFDPYVKRARIEHADPETLDFVPPWYGERVLAHAEAHGARVTLAGATAPNLLAGLDPRSSAATSCRA